MRIDTAFDTIEGAFHSAERDDNGDYCVYYQTDGEIMVVTLTIEDMQRILAAPNATE